VEIRIDLGARQNIKLVGGHHWRFHPAYQCAAALVQSGALGGAGCASSPVAPACWRTTERI